MDVAIKPAFMAQVPPFTRVDSPQFAPAAERVYIDALDALDAAGIPYLLGGAVALNAHSGVWRDTKDLDVFVRPVDGKRAVDALAATDLHSEIVYESWLGKASQGDVFVDIIWRNANALFPVEDSWFLRETYLHLLGRDVPIVPLEEFLLSKMMVMGRYRFDGADMLHVLYARGEVIDWRRLAVLCGEHVGVMLAHMHLFRWAYPAVADRVPLGAIDAFTTLAQDPPSTTGPFRGRLLDIPSFEVDVNEWGMPDPHKLALERIFGSAEGRS